MQERKVSEAQVEEVVDQPDELEIGDQDEWVAIRTYGDRRIEVVYGDIDDPRDAAVDNDTVLVYTVISVRLLR